MNNYNPNIHHRRSIRLKGYDYSLVGVYFITLCTQNRAHLFGEIRNGEMILNDAGKMVEAEWLILKNRFPNIELHEFVVMPNHFHGILEITTATPIRATPVGATPVGAPVRATPVGAIPVGAPVRATPVGATLVVAQNKNKNKNKKEEGQPQGIAPTIGTMIDAFKSIVTVNYIRGVKQNNWTPFDGKLWQRNYYEHIIRNDESYMRISKYIINNPAKWDIDKLKQ